MVIAGSDTVSQGSTALFRYITGNTDVQKRLREEVRKEFEGQDIDAATLARLPYVEACVLESLRMLPPVAAGKQSLDRRVFALKLRMQVLLGTHKPEIKF